MKKFTALTIPLCFLVSTNSVYAAGVNGLPPVVVHPVHNVLPVSNGSHVLTNTTNSGGANNSAGNSNTSSTGNHSGGTQSSGSQTSSANPTASGNQSSSGNQQHKSVHSTHSNTSTIAHAGNTSVVTALTTTSSSSNAVALPSGGYQLDLTSSVANVVLGSALFGHASSVNINVGGTNQSFSAGQKVTAAEYVAIQQTLGAAHGQTLVLNAQGAADAGKFSLNSAVNANVDEVVVPKGVTAIDTLSKNNSLTIAGDLLNYGSIYGVSTSHSTTSGIISAADITNEKGGVISTVLPNSLLASTGTTTSNVDLTLSAQNNFSNSGTITSAGALTLATATHGYKIDAITRTLFGGRRDLKILDWGMGFGRIAMAIKRLFNPEADISGYDIDQFNVLRG